MAGNSRWKSYTEEVSGIVPPSPAVDRSLMMRSSVLKRSFNTTDKINTSLRTIDSVLMGSPIVATPMQYQATPPVSSRDESERPIHNVTLMDTFASSMREIPLMSSPTHTDNSLIFTPHGEAELSRMTELSLAVDTTDVTFYDHPELQAGLDLMVTFHHHLQAFNNTSEAIELIDALEKTCNEQVGHLKTLEYSKHIRKALDELKLERDTWQLIRALYTDRLFYDQDDDNSLNMEELVPRTDGEIIEEFFINVGDVRQAQVVIDWLEKIAASDLDDLSTKVKYFADSVSWDSTMHDIQYGLNKGHIVTEVDPDCRSRQKKPLSELDEKDELSLSKHLFECIRAGELDKAQQLCIQCGQSWRAATFNGWKLYHDPNLYKDIGSDLDDVGGNPTRDLWKSSCWNLMKCATFGNYEKAIYAAMSGNLSCLLKVCNTWYDCLWSYYRVMIDVLVEKKLRTSNRYPSDYQFVQLPDEYWDAILTPEVIFQEIEANPSQNIKRQCLNYYHLTQKHIILGSLDDLIDEMYFWLKEKQSANGHTMRFMAHIALFIRSISSTYNEEKCNSILESFIMMLISNQLNDLVPLYCSYLPHELQLKCYCNFLSGITEPKEQKKCLELAAQNGLDLTSITKGVVEKLRNMEIVEEGNIQLTADGDGISQNDWNRINSLDWLLYKTSDRHEAIYQANALIRLFIIADKHPAAVAVYERIPDDSINVIKQNWMIENGEVPYSAKFNDDLHEWLCIKVYLEAIGLFNDWFHEFHHSKPMLPTSALGDNFKEKIALERREEEYKELVIQWEKRIDFMTKEVVKKMYNVLLFVKGWMVEDGDKSSVRSRQMKKLRQICIPKICFLLHSVHHSTGKYSQCLRLVDVITSEFNCLYKEFNREELTQLIHCLSQSAIEQSASLKLDSFGYSST